MVIWYKYWFTRISYGVWYSWCFIRVLSRIMNRLLLSQCCYIYFLMISTLNIRWRKLQMWFLCPEQSRSGTRWSLVPHYPFWISSSWTCFNYWPMLLHWVLKWYFSTACRHTNYPLPDKNNIGAQALPLSSSRDEKITSNIESSNNIHFVLHQFEVCHILYIACQLH